MTPDVRDQRLITPIIGLGRRPIKRQTKRSVFHALMLPMGNIAASVLCIAERSLSVPEQRIQSDHNRSLVLVWHGTSRFNSAPSVQPLFKNGRPIYVATHDPHIAGESSRRKNRHLYHSRQQPALTRFEPRAARWNRSDGTTPA